jgi:iron(III) transport system substrate-binding protein
MALTCTNSFGWFNAMTTICRATAGPRAIGAVLTLLLLLLTGSAARSADAALIEAAKKEGEVVWYTTQVMDVIVRPISAAFERLYGIKVRAVRASTSVLATRIYNETKAAQPQVDVFDGTTTVAPLKKEGFVLQWLPDTAKNLPAEYKDRDGYWAATNVYVITAAYNTHLVSQADAPKTLNDLLDPKWLGRMAWSAMPSSSAGPGFVGTLVADMGKDKATAYLQKLSRQAIASVGSLASAVLEEIISGEFAIGLQMFNHQAVERAAKGAPVQWLPIEPATSVLEFISVHNSAPHPNAAKLLVDFILSPQGQTIYQAGHYLPADPAIAPLDPALSPRARENSAPSPSRRNRSRKRCRSGKAISTKFSGDERLAQSPIACARTRLFLSHPSL